MKNYKLVGKWGKNTTPQQVFNYTDTLGEIIYELVVI